MDETVILGKEKPEVEPELEVLLSGPVVDDGVDERHEGRLDVDVVAVLPRAPVKVVYYALKSGPFAGELLVVEHGLEDLLVAAGHDADGALINELIQVNKSY